MLSPPAAKVVFTLKLVFGPNASMDTDVLPDIGSGTDALSSGVNILSADILMLGLLKTGQTLQEGTDKQWLRNNGQSLKRGTFAAYSEVWGGYLHAG